MKQYEILTDRQKKFAEIYVEISNGTQSALQAGYGKTGAYVEASRLLKNPKVREYIDELQKERRERVQARLATMAVKASEMMYELAQSAESESVRLAAIKDILDRSGYKPSDKIESKTQMSGKIEFGFVEPGNDDKSL